MIMTNQSKSICRNSILSKFRSNDPEWRDPLANTQDISKVVGKSIESKKLKTNSKAIIMRLVNRHFILQNVKASLYISSGKGQCHV